ncbi:class I SAM-dependent methyltransferase [Candidatus Nomurabacteria bacterium]|nr:class I SAM-dependent methyltransferase [Candidatus Nomurabacteria bacterium]
MRYLPDIQRDEIFNADKLQRLYQSRFGGRLEYRDKVWRILVKEYFQQWVGGGVVLDLGAGYGEFLNNIKCTKKYAMDLNPETSLRVNKDVEVLVQNCADAWPLLDDSLDVVFTSNFLEHLPDKQTLSRALNEAIRCLKPGGRIVAIGPNIKYAPGAYWDYWDHHVPLTEQSLAEAMNLEGFDIERCIDKFLPFTMATGPRYPTFLVAVYLRFPIVWRIFGRQFFVVGRKKFASHNT